MWASIKWLLSVLVGGVAEIIKLIIKTLLILVILACAFFALGKALETEYQELKTSVVNSVDNTPMGKLGWRGLLKAGTDPPMLYTTPDLPSNSSGYFHPYGEQSPQIYLGHLTPLRL